MYLGAAGHFSAQKSQEDLGSLCQRLKEQYTVLFQVPSPFFALNPVELSVHKVFSSAEVNNISAVNS